MSLADEKLGKYDSVLTMNFCGYEIPVYKFIEHYIKIVNKDSEVVPLIMNYQQVELYAEICEQILDGRPVRIDILKARQIGFTTFIAALFFSLTLFSKNVRTAIIADIVDHAHNIFSKLQFYYDHLDDENPNKELIDKMVDEGNEEAARKLSYKPKLAKNRGGEFLLTEEGNSSIEVITAGKKAGRSGTYQYVHGSEVAFFDDLSNTLNGLLETVSRTNKKSMIFLETTANGFNEYKDLWDKHVSGKSSFKAFFTPWFENPQYSKDLLKGQDMPILEDWLYKMQEKYSLTNEQMLWFNEVYYDKNCDKGLTLQEYPFSAQDAFLVTGSCVFGSEEVAERKEQVVKKPNLGVIRQGQYTYKTHFTEKGDHISLTDEEFRNRLNGIIKIYEEPVEGRPYVGICDPNNGGSDFSAIQIIDNRNLRQVAVMKTSDLPLDEVAYQFYCLGMAYNVALLSNEMNLGKTVMEYLIKLSYPKLYIDQSMSFDSYKQGLSTRYGHKTEKSNRQYMIDSLKIAFRQDPSIINDYDTLCQMETFQKSKHQSRTGSVTFKDEASHGEHDDLVMSYAAFFVVRVQQTTLTVENRQEIRNQLTVAQLERVLEEKRRKPVQASVSAFERTVGIDFGGDYGDW